jgi:hypothetical protein
MESQSPNTLPGHTYDIKVLLRVYVALIVLMGGMVVVSLIPAEGIKGLEWIDLHVLKGLIIFGIATAMISIVSGFLMGLKYEKSKLNTVVFLGNFAFLALFIIFTWADIGYRGIVYPNFTKQLNWESPVDKANAEHAAEEHQAATAPEPPAH